MRSGMRGAGRALLALALWGCGEKIDPFGSGDDPGTLPPGLEAGQVCYSAHVEPILRQSCLGCHHQGFTFRKGLTLDDPAVLRQNLDLVVRVTGNRVMPPLDLDVPGTDAPAPRLTGEQRAILRAWRDNGARDCGP